MLTYCGGYFNEFSINRRVRARVECPNCVVSCTSNIYILSSRNCAIVSDFKMIGTLFMCRIKRLKLLSIQYAYCFSVTVSIPTGIHSFGILKNC